MAALLFRETEGKAVAEQLKGAVLLAPALIASELASVHVRKIRTGAFEVTPEAVFAPLHQLGLQLFNTDPAAVAALALSSGLSAYDASYLLLAQERGAHLVTLDLKLKKAFEKLKRN